MSKWMAKRAYKITPLTKEEVSEYGEKYLAAYEIVEDLALRNNIKMPEFGIYESQDPNAFATGASKNNSLVALSTGLVESMDKGAIE
jgi:heat shock protein HtpX